MHISKMSFEEIAISITITDNDNNGSTCYMTISTFNTLDDAESVILRFCLLMIDRILDGHGAPIQVFESNHYVT